MTVHVLKRRKRRRRKSRRRRRRRRPHVRESGFRKNFSCGIWNPGLWNPGLWNPEYSLRNPESYWGLESRIQVPLTKIGIIIIIIIIIWRRSSFTAVQEFKTTWLYFTWLGVLCSFQVNILQNPWLSLTVCGFDYNKELPGVHSWF